MSQSWVRWAGEEGRGPKSKFANWTEDWLQVAIQDLSATNQNLFLKCVCARMRACVYERERERRKRRRKRDDKRPRFYFL